MIRSLIKAIVQRAYLGTRYHVLPRLGHEIMRRRSPDRLLSQWPEGEIPLGPTVCVFVHWDAAGDVRPHVQHQVQSLADEGVSVVFVTNSGRLRADAMERLKPICAGIMIRQNVGYDFGAWREGLSKLSLPRPNTAMVLIANDSVYGPLRPIDALLAHINLAQADFWGCTDSWQHRYHLQSYFMAFSPAVVASPVWRTFWLGVQPTWSKNWLIRLYEIGLTQALIRAGFRARAIWPYQKLIQDIDLDLLVDAQDGGPNLADPAVSMRQKHVRQLRSAVVQRIALNPTSDLWRQLLRAGYPFLKRELLRDNPSMVPDIAEWRSVVAETRGGVTPSAMAAIELDLQRTLRNKAP